MPITVAAQGKSVSVASRAPALLHPKEIEQLLVERSDLTSAAPIKVTGPLRSAGFSRVFRGEGAMFPRPVAIKQFLHDPSGASPAESAQAYFCGLQRMASIADRIGLPSIEPYVLLESHGIVVATWVEGRTLAQSLLQEGAARRRKLIYDAGVWLAKLHQACGVERSPPDMAGMLARLEAELTENNRATGLFIRRALTELRAVDPTLAAQPVAWSRHYGDFKPDNLIVQQDRLVAMDVELLYAAPTVMDAAHFLNQLQFAYYSLRAIPRRRECRKLIDLFCQGYADAAGEPLPHRLLLWQRLYNAVYFTAQCRKWSRSPTAWPLQLIMGHLVQTLCNILTS